MPGCAAPTAACPEGQARRWGPEAGQRFVPMSGMEGLSMDQKGDFARRRVL